MSGAGIGGQDLGPPAFPPIAINYIKKRLRRNKKRVVIFGYQKMSDFFSFWLYFSLDYVFIIEKTVINFIF